MELRSVLIVLNVMKWAVEEEGSEEAGEADSTEVILSVKGRMVDAVLVEDLVGTEKTEEGSVVVEEVALVVIVEEGLEVIEEVIEEAIEEAIEEVIEEVASAATGKHPEAEEVLVATVEGLVAIERAASTETDEKSAGQMCIKVF